MVANDSESLKQLIVKASLDCTCTYRSHLCQYQYVVNVSSDANSHNILSTAQI